MVTPVETAPLLCSQRLMLAVLTFFGHLFVYSSRANLSMAMLCMVRSDGPSNSTSFGLDADNKTNQADRDIVRDEKDADELGEFFWSKGMQSQLLIMYFCGYMLTQIPGGWLSSKFGGKRVWGLSHFLVAVCTLLTPPAARTNYYLICAVRFVLGFSAGVSFPTVKAMFGKWAPPHERSRLLSYTMIGPPAGTISTLIVSGILCEYGFDNGWASIFYLCGIANLIWVGIWFFLAADTPDTQKRITERELKYIQSNNGKEAGKMITKVPWLAMLKSGPLWGLIAVHNASSYTIGTLVLLLPMFMKEVLQFDIKQNGILSSLPFITMAVGTLFFCHMADMSIKGGWLSVKNTRKVCQSISLLGTAVMFCILVQFDASKRYWVVGMICVASALNSASRAGYSCNHIDLAPSYCGIMFGITNTASNLFALLGPLVAGALTPNGTHEEWQNVFYVCSAICVGACILYIILADGEIQSWAVIADPVIDDVSVEGEPLTQNQDDVMIASDRNPLKVDTHGKEMDVTL